ncbi:uncharacterized protein LOC129961718 [Argiope bruennichi]|uniref:uncharacterized protein LOC129961718 n=1 Tax=Argiope bruennichi TaxID=94029 RepID=UPI00249498BE|nr:uncharacterized protein LOC129961718 [Argiope bruennichi]
MSGNNEDEGRCARACSVCSSGCLDRIHRIGSRIRSFPYRQCFMALPKKLEQHYVASLIVFLSAALSVTSWFEFNLETSVSVSAYCIALIFCAGLTFLLERGECCSGRQIDFRLVQDDSVNQACVIRPEADRVVRDPGNGSEQPLPEDLANQMEQRPVSPRAPELTVAKVEVHKSAQSSESSSSDEPAFAVKDEPVQQALAPDLGKNVPLTSTETSISTSSTPLKC